MIHIHRDPYGHAQPIRTLRKLWGACRMILTSLEQKYPSAVEDFEMKFADYIGRKYPASFCNGTSSLDAVLFALGIGPGDRVLVPTVTFHASVSPLLQMGATPVFVDVDPRTGNIDLIDLEKKASLAKFLIVTHNWGNPIDMEALQRITSEHSLTMVEDCSLTHGASWRGKKLGSFGTASLFSLQAQKAVSAGEGGICLTDDKRLWERMLLFGHFGRLSRKARSSEHDGFPAWGWGQKRRAHPIGLAMASVDLEYLDSDNVKRREILEELRQWLRHLNSKYTILAPPDGGRFGGGAGSIALCSRSGPVKPLVKRLQAAGISAGRCHYSALHLEPLFLDLELRNALLTGQTQSAQAPQDGRSCPAAVDFVDRVFFLPLNRTVLRAKREEILNILEESYPTSHGENSC